MYKQNKTKQNKKAIGNLKKKQWLTKWLNIIRKIPKSINLAWIAVNESVD